MKYQFLLSLFMVFFTVSATNSHAQVLKKIKDRVKETAENKVVDRAGNATSESIDKAEESLKKNSNDNKEKEATGAEKNTSDNTTEPATDTVQPSNENAAVIAYKNYDFVPGEKVIYFYDMEGEKDAEIPGRMLINDGTVEIQSFNNEKVLFVPKDANVSMIPYMDSDSYLPEQFTLEFEILTNEEASGLPAIELYFSHPTEPMMPGV